MNKRTFTRPDRQQVECTDDTIMPGDRAYMPETDHMIIVKDVGDNFLIDYRDNFHHNNRGPFHFYRVIGEPFSAAQFQCQVASVFKQCDFEADIIRKVNAVYNSGGFRESDFNTDDNTIPRAILYAIFVDFGSRITPSTKKEQKALKTILNALKK